MADILTDEEKKQFQASMQGALDKEKRTYKKKERTEKQKIDLGACRNNAIAIALDSVIFSTLEKTFHISYSSEEKIAGSIGAATVYTLQYYSVDTDKPIFIFLSAIASLALITFSKKSETKKETEKATLEIPKGYSGAIKQE